MNPVTGFLRGYLSSTEMWLFLPLLVSVLMAVVIFVVLQHALTSDDKSTGLIKEDEAAFRQRMLDMGKEVTRKANDKAERDRSAIAATQVRLQQQKGEDTTQADTPATVNDPSTLAASSASSSLAGAVSDLRRRRGAAKAKAAVASGDSSDNDWELVDNEDVRMAGDSEQPYQLPTAFQQATDDFIESIHQRSNSRTQQHIG